MVGVAPAAGFAHQARQLVGRGGDLGGELEGRGWVRHDHVLDPETRARASAQAASGTGRPRAATSPRKRSTRHAPGAAPAPAALPTGPVSPMRVRPSPASTARTGASRPRRVTRAWAGPPPITPPGSVSPTRTAA